MAGLTIQSVVILIVLLLGTLMANARVVSEKHRFLFGRLLDKQVIII